MFALAPCWALSHRSDFKQLLWRHFRGCVVTLAIELYSYIHTLSLFADFYRRNTLNLSPDLIYISKTTCSFIECTVITWIIHMVVLKRQSFPDFPCIWRASQVLFLRQILPQNIHVWWCCASLWQMIWQHSDFSQALLFVCSVRLSNRSENSFRTSPEFIPVILRQQCPLCNSRGARGRKREWGTKGNLSVCVRVGGLSGDTRSARLTQTHLHHSKHHT